jgi:hypothetical protein
MFGSNAVRSNNKDGWPMPHLMSSRNSLSGAIAAIKEFDEQHNYVVRSATGEHVPFQIGIMFDSLFQSGLGFYEALKIIEELEPRFHSGMSSNDITTLIIGKLEGTNSNWAREFKTKFDVGINVRRHDSGGLEPLSVGVIKDIVKRELWRIGFEWPGFLRDTCNLIMLKCRNLGIQEIAETLVLEVFYEEIRVLLGGRTIDEFKDDLPSLIRSVPSSLKNLAKHTSIADRYWGLLSEGETLAKALLTRYGNIPPPRNGECFAALIRLFEQGKTEESTLHKDLASYEAERRAIGPKSLLITVTQKKPDEYVSNRAQTTYRRFSILVGPDESNLKARLTSSDYVQDHQVIEYLAGFSVFLWPEDWMAASTLEEIRRSVMLLLYRYRVLDRFKLTRLLQIHPKHTARALIPLQRQGLIALHSVTDGDLIIITRSGEVHCEESYGFRIRCSLSKL